MASIEVKIKKLDGELARYKEQMSRLRNGPGKVSTRPSPFSRSIPYPCPRLLNKGPAECYPGACSQDAEAEADVRVTARTADAADVQHGVRGARDREPAEYDGDRRCDAAREQGTAQTIRQDRH